MALTAILLTTLFSNFRQIVVTNIKIKELREKFHWSYVTQLRLGQIFEKLSQFKTSKHPDSDQLALYFSIDNKIDYDPLFCGKLEGQLYFDKKKQLCLLLRTLSGMERKEVFVKKGSGFFLKFFDPEKNEWVHLWEETALPPLIKLEIEGQILTFLIPHAKRKAVY